MESGYQEQFERVKRYFERFKKINEGKQHNQSSPHHDDDVYAFFQNCYHLKDWIKNDKSCSKQSCVEAFIESNSNLRICADLCNSLKHLKLNDRTRSNKKPEFSGSNTSINIDEGFSQQTEVGISISYKIKTVDGDINAFDLAKKCVDIWEIYINSNKKTSAKS